MARTNKAHRLTSADIRAILPALRLEVQRLGFAVAHCEKRLDGYDGTGHVAEACRRDLREHIDRLRAKAAALEAVIEKLR